MYIHSVIKDKSMICFVYTPSSQQFIVNVPDDKELYNDFTGPATDTCSPSSLKPLYWSFIHVVVSRKSSTVYGSHQSFNFPLLSYWRPTITHLNQNPGVLFRKNLKLFDGRIFFLDCQDFRVGMPSFKNDDSCLHNIYVELQNKK